MAQAPPSRTRRLVPKQPAKDILAGDRGRHMENFRPLIPIVTNHKENRKLRVYRFFAAVCADRAGVRAVAEDLPVPTASSIAYET
jgi:hypothetical protein